MRMIVIGAGGHIGRVIARELARGPEAEPVTLVDVNRPALVQAASLVETVGGRARPIVLEDSSIDGLARLLEGHQVAVQALPVWDASYRGIEAAIRTGVHVVDILEEYHRRPDAQEAHGLPIPEGLTPNQYGEDLHRRAAEAGITVLDGMGFAPGLTNVTLGEGIRRMDRADSAIARAGGIPTHEAALRHPLKYMITWAFDHVLREYMAPSTVIQGGHVTTVGAMSGFERFRFEALERAEELEAVITPGMPSFVHTRPELEEFAEKTIRWPGHWAAIAALREAGMLDEAPVEVDGQQVSPRHFLSVVLAPRLQPLPGDRDACVMWNTVSGEKDGQPARIDYYMWDEAAQKTSAMARVTAYPAAIAAQLIGQGVIAAPGLSAPEDAIHGESYSALVQALAEHGVIIEERAENC